MLRIRLGDGLWYVSVMQKASPSVDSNAGPVRRRPLPLSVIHARSLYRPVPPVGRDDDGYVCEDGAMSESSAHDEQRGYAGTVLRNRYLDDPNVFVGCNLTVHFERGNRSAMVVPDVFVSFGAVKQPRLSYKIWEEPGPPDFVLELVSYSNWRRDVLQKPDLYADLGVREYWLADPNGCRGDGGPVLVGYRFSADGGREMLGGRPQRARQGARSPLRDPAGSYSEVLDLELVVEDGGFMFRDPGSGEIVPDYHEMTVMRDDETTRARVAEARAKTAEARVAELEQQLDELAGKP